MRQLHRTAMIAIELASRKGLTALPNITERIGRASVIILDDYTADDAILDIFLCEGVITLKWQGCRRHQALLDEVQEAVQRQAA